MKKYFIVSDVHSFYYILIKTLEDSGFDLNDSNHYLVVCGDLFDRGDETVELFEFVKNLGDRFIYVRGNHEDLLEKCLQDISNGFTPGHHHFSNGTIKTICQFCNSNEWIIYDPSNRNFIIETMTPVLEYINSKTVDYFDINSNFVCVHGWLPISETTKDYHTAESWLWKEARWKNGMDMWCNPANRVEGKTVICGHFHCSWGWSHIDQKYKEYPQYSHKHFQYSFQPWKKEGIIAIDACTAYSKKINCLVIEEQ